MDMDDASISLGSKFSVLLANSILSNAYSCNKWLEIFYIIVGGILRGEMMGVLT